MSKPRAIGLAKSERYIVRALFESRTVATTRARGFFGCAMSALALGATLSDRGKRADRWEYWLYRRGRYGGRYVFIAGDDVREARP